MPDPVIYNAINYHNDYIYITGGYKGLDFEKNPGGSFYRYSLTENLWENITNESYSPVSINAPGVIYGDYLYIIFGLYHLYFNPYIWRINLIDQKWNWETVSIINPYLRWGFSLRGSGNKFYAFGGGLDTFFNDLKMFTFDNNTVNIANVTLNFLYPPPRSDHILVQINNYFYLFGGIGFNGFLSDMWMFDIKNEIWTGINQAGDIPSARHLFAYASFASTIIIFGGEDSSGLKDDLYSFNAITNTWTYIAPASSSTPSQRKGACAVIEMPYLYIYGGETYFAISNELWQYDMGKNTFNLIAESLLGIAYGTCQLIENAFFSYLGLDSDGETYIRISKYNITSDLWSLTSVNDVDVGGIQGLAFTINENVFYYGGINIYSQYYSGLHIYNPNGSFVINTGVSPYRMAFAFYKTSLYINGGGSINMYKRINGNMHSTMFYSMNLNELFDGAIFPCSPGTESDGSDCVPCGVGTYSDSFSNETCTPCNLGTYNNKLGANSRRQCIPCPYGTFSNNSGTDLCNQCNWIDFCPIGSKIPQSKSNVSTLSSIQPPNYNSLQNANLISDIQAYVTAAMLLGAFVLIFSCFSKVKHFDIYAQYHNHQYYTPMILQNTTFGGAFTLIFFAYALILITSGLFTYLLQNINEIKTLQPLVILETRVKIFYASIEVQISLMQYLDTCGDNGQCSSLIFVNMSGIQTESINTTSSLNCYMAKNSSCIITYSCVSCYLLPDAFMQVTLHEDLSIASGIFVSVTSTSSIPESDSYIQAGIIADNDKVFAGGIPTIFSFSMIPSYFESDSSAYISSSTGYHVTQETSPLAGSQNTIDNLESVSELIVEVDLTLSTIGLYTTRLVVQKLFVLVSALLGSISGALGAVRFLMSFSEKKYSHYQIYYKKKKKFFEILKNNYKMKHILAPKCISENNDFKINHCEKIEFVNVRSSQNTPVDLLVKL